MAPPAHFDALTHTDARHAHDLDNGSEHGAESAFTLAAADAEALLPLPHPLAYDVHLDAGMVGLDGLHEQGEGHGHGHEHTPINEEGAAAELEDLARAVRGMQDEPLVQHDHREDDGPAGPSGSGVDVGYSHEDDGALGDALQEQEQEAGEMGDMDPALREIVKSLTNAQRAQQSHTDDQETEDEGLAEGSQAAGDSSDVSDLHARHVDHAASAQYHDPALGAPESHAHSDEAQHHAHLIAAAAAAAAAAAGGLPQVHAQLPEHYDGAANIDHALQTSLAELTPEQLSSFFPSHPDYALDYDHAGLHPTGEEPYSLSGVQDGQRARGEVAEGEPYGDEAFSGAFVHEYPYAAGSAAEGSSGRVETGSEAGTNAILPVKRGRGRPKGSKNKPKVRLIHSLEAYAAQTAHAVSDPPVYASGHDLRESIDHGESPGGLESPTGAPSDIGFADSAPIEGVDPASRPRKRRRRAASPQTSGEKGKPGRPFKHREGAELERFLRKRADLAAGVRRGRGRPRKYPGHLVREMRLKVNKTERLEVLRRYGEGGVLGGDAEEGEREGDPGPSTAQYQAALERERERVMMRMRPSKADGGAGGDGDGDGAQGDGSSHGIDGDGGDGADAVDARDGDDEMMDMAMAMAMPLEMRDEAEAEAEVAAVAGAWGWDDVEGEGTESIAPPSSSPMGRRVAAAAAAAAVALPIPGVDVGPDPAVPLAEGVPLPVEAREMPAGARGEAKHVTEAEPDAEAEAEGDQDTDQSLLYAVKAHFAAEAVKEEEGDGRALRTRPREGAQVSRELE